MKFNAIISKLILIINPLKLFWIFILFNYPINAQNKNLTNLASNFNKLTENLNQDLLYVQTSKDIYETEEDLWFKVYALDAQQLLPSKRNKVLFAQLINSKTNESVWEERYEIENGFVDGHILLDASLKEGDYKLNVYSEHSFFKNQKEFYAFKELKIYKRINNKLVQPFVKNDSIAEFKLFPEGGYLVSDFQNRLAFKAINKQGFPFKVSGTLFENDIPIRKFKSLHAGMGKFIFIPNASNKYYIKLNEDKKQVYQLPQIKATGKVLHLVSNSANSLLFSISKNDTIKEETVYVRLQSRGVLYALAKAKIKDKVAIKLDLKNIPQGIAEVTLFNSELQPIAERLVYVKLDEKLKIKTSLDRFSYKTRGKVRIKITTTDKDDKPVVAHLDVSVFDKVYQNIQDSKTIQTHYNLSTQIKGRIYNPNYYFHEENKNRKQALDVLMLTQGWRSYQWSENDLKKNEKEKILSDFVKGKILGRRKRDEKLGIPLYIGAFNAKNQNSKKFIAVDSLQNFTVRSEQLKIADKGYLYLKLFIPEYSTQYMSVIDTVFKAIENKRKEQIIYYPKSNTSYIKDESYQPFRIPEGSIKLNEVSVITKLKRTFRDKFVGKLDSLAKLNLNSDYVCSENFLNCPIHQLLSESKKPVDGKSYHMYVNFDENRNLVKQIKYEYPKYTEEQLFELFNILRIKGFYGKRKFYETKYDKNSINDPIPDYRNTLFWKPDVITDQNGQAIINFYCSDINSVFIGDVEGVSQNGLLGNSTFKFKVNKR